MSYCSSAYHQGILTKVLYCCGNNNQSGHKVCEKLTHMRSITMGKT